MRHGRAGGPLLGAKGIRTGVYKRRVGLVDFDSKQSTCNMCAKLSSFTPFHTTHLRDTHTPLDQIPEALPALYPLGTSPAGGGCPVALGTSPAGGGCPVALGTSPAGGGCPVVLATREWLSGGTWDQPCRG